MLFGQDDDLEWGDVDLERSRQRAAMTLSRVAMDRLGQDRLRMYLDANAQRGIMQQIMLWARQNNPMQRNALRAQMQALLLGAHVAANVAEYYGWQLARDLYVSAGNYYHMSVKADEAQKGKEPPAKAEDKDAPMDEEMKDNGETKEVTVDGNGETEMTPTRPAKRPKLKHSPELEKKRQLDRAKLRDRLGLDPIQEDTEMADVEMGSGSGSASAAMSTGNPGVDGANQNKVTPVSAFDYAYEGVPRQYTTILPYWQQINNQNVAYAIGPIIYIRMNSIYDIIKTDGGFVNWATSADPNPVADTPDSAGTPILEAPYWRKWWAQFYEYWTVTECRWKLTFQQNAETNDRSLAVGYGYTGLQKIPHIDNTSGTPLGLTCQDYKRFKGFKWKYGRTLTSRSGSEVNGLAEREHKHDNLMSIQGVYHPGDGSHEVIEDELAQTWVRGDAVPKEQNLLAVILRQSPLSPVQLDVTGAISVTIRIELEYVVQYKDIKAKWQFPVKNNIFLAGSTTEDAFYQTNS